MSRETEENITRILKDVRRESTEQPQQPSTSNPGPSMMWGSQGACGVGEPGGQETTDFASLSSTSHSRQPVSEAVTIQVELCGRLGCEIIVASIFMYMV